MINKRKSILVVEDEPIIRMTLTDHLETVGFEVIEAGSGDRAKEILESGAGINLVITDVRMPGWTDGIALALWVREYRPDIKIIIVSGATDWSPILKGLGAEGVIIPKPYSIEVIGRHAKELLNSDPA